MKREIRLLEKWLISGRYVLVRAYSRMVELHPLLAIVVVSMREKFIFSLLTSVST